MTASRPGTGCGEAVVTFAVGMVGAGLGPLWELERSTTPAVVFLPPLGEEVEPPLLSWLVGRAVGMLQVVGQVGLQPLHDSPFE